MTALHHRRMWLPWERARLRAWADELEAAGDVLGDRIGRSLEAPVGASLGLRAKLSSEANRASQAGVGVGAVALLRVLDGFEARWQHGVIVSLRPRLFADEWADELADEQVGEQVGEPTTSERLAQLLHEPVARYLQELALPAGWGVGARGSTPSPVAAVVSALVGGDVELRVLQIGSAHELGAYHERLGPRPQGVQALRQLLNRSDAGAPAVGSLDPSAQALLRPARGLQALCWGHFMMPLWSIGPADNPTRLARLNAWLARPEPTATALALVARGLWDRSSSVRQRALVGLGELGLAGASLVPELLRARQRPSGWSHDLYTTIDKLSERPAFVEAFAPRLRADEAGHLRWLKQTRSVGAKAAIPTLTRALAIVPTPVPSGLGEVPPEWRRREWRELVLRLRNL